jgi:hypothetical protein
MTRFGSFVLCATLAVSVAACGGGSDSSSSVDPMQAVPLSNAVSGWTVDESISKSPGERAMKATDEAGAINFVDGAAQAFYKDPFKPTAFLWQNYLNMTLPKAPAPKGASISLYIVEMPSADQASSLYQGLLVESEYTRRDWETPTSPALGAASRIQDTANAWWVNFYKGANYVEAFMYPSYAPAPDYTPSDPDLKAEVLRFAKAVADKL